MSVYRYAIIGTGRPWKSDGATGFGMSHTHQHGFAKTGRTELVAVADVREDNARLFLDKYNVDAPIFTNYDEMLAEIKPEILSIATWPHLHADMTVAACEAGVKAIHCEKPMATTWGDAKRMKAAADANGTLVTFNHQRRNLESFQKARQIILSGELGDLTLMECECGNLFDWGTHWLDMLFFFNGDVPAEWVIGQIDLREPDVIFGAPMEQQGLVYWKWTNGVRGIMVTGHDSKLTTMMRLTGTKGIIELPSENALKVRTEQDSDWRVIPMIENIKGSDPIDLACADLIKALDTPGYKPLLSIDYAIQHTEVIYAAYESSRWRGRIDLPLKTEDSALVSMLESGEIGPKRRAQPSVQ